MTADDFVARVGMLLQRVDQRAAGRAQAELAFQQSVAQSQVASPAQQLKDVGKVVADLKLDNKQFEDLLKLVGFQTNAGGGGGGSDAQQSGLARDTSGSSSAASSDSDAKIEEVTKKDGTKSAGADLRQAAQKRVQDARKELREVSDQLDEELAKGRNYIIFRWTEEEENVAKAGASGQLRFSASATRSNTGYAVAAGIRRQRLLIGRDLTEQYEKIDPRNKLVKWYEDAWSGTGLVTEILQVEAIQYFTKGQFERIFEVILTASPAELQGLLTPAGLMSLKLSLTMTAQHLASYENRAMLRPSERTKTCVDWDGLVSPSESEPAWTTLVTVATSLRYLERVGRLKR
ncbi:MAG: hypothetical protein E2O95_02875 [Acidobacteria bacterium]|nr:MAG: hypothetical protein E2O95_02875 [Acidobacteriota bacterium]